MPYGDNTALKYDPFEEIYALRYEAYLDNDSIDANSERLFFDEYDYTNNCVSFVEYREGLAAGSIRACVYNPDLPHMPIPAMDVYSEELSHSIGMNKIFIEANKLVIKPQFQNLNRSIVISLFKQVFDYALELNAEYLLAAPRPEQVKLYKYMLFKPIAGIKAYPHLKFQTTLLACELETARAEVRNNPRLKVLKQLGFG